MEGELQEGTRVRAYECDKPLHVNNGDVIRMEIDQDGNGYAWIEKSKSAGEMRSALYQQLINAHIRPPYALPIQDGLADDPGNDPGPERPEQHDHP